MRFSRKCSRMICDQVLSQDLASGSPFATVDHWEFTRFCVRGLYAWMICRGEKLWRLESSRWRGWRGGRLLGSAQLRDLAVGVGLAACMVLRHLHPALYNVRLPLAPSSLSSSPLQSPFPSHIFTILPPRHIYCYLPILILAPGLPRPPSYPYRHHDSISPSVHARFA